MAPTVCLAVAGGVGAEQRKPCLRCARGGPTLIETSAYRVLGGLPRPRYGGGAGPHWGGLTPGGD